MPQKPWVLILKRLLKLVRILFTAQVAASVAARGSAFEGAGRGDK